MRRSLTASIDANREYFRYYDVNVDIVICISGVIACVSCCWFDRDQDKPSHVNHNPALNKDNG